MKTKIKKIKKKLIKQKKINNNDLISNASSKIQSYANSKEKEETEIDFKHGKKKRKIIEVVNLDNKNKYCIIIINFLKKTIKKYKIKSV